MIRAEYSSNQIKRKPETKMEKTKTEVNCNNLMRHFNVFKRKKRRNHELDFMSMCGFFSTAPCYLI